MSAPETSSLSPYVYQDLTKPTNLRLLKLSPASPSQGDIDGELFEADSIESLDAIIFHAVSWCWGKGEFDRSLRLHVDNQVYSFPISANLESALRGLRWEDKVRFLWIDAICINQSNTRERNEQVPKMDQVYGRAEKVCIWLGEGNDESKMALDFIKSKVLSLWKFDELCEDLGMAHHWAALIRLMSRPWFSRRWVVQEIALTSKGTLQCGREVIDWHDFADAVALFVEVESATHRLSEVMKREQTFNHIPDFFGHVPALGAALLVDATSNLFRSSKNGERKPLSSLEYLVSRLAVFEATQPRDTIYALLSIAKDTTPQAAPPKLPISASSAERLEFWAQRNLARETYRVDYGLPVVEVYKDFIDFAIRRSVKSSALDVICRPWAPRVRQSDNRAGTTQDWNVGNNPVNLPDEEEPLPSWIPSLSGAAWIMNEHPTAGLRMERKNADSLVGMPTFGERNYSAAGTLDVTNICPRFKKREKYYSMFVKGFILDEVKKVGEPARLGNIPFTWLSMGHWNDTNEDPPSAFWRTLVADRGPNGRNPPTFYPRACKESLSKVIAGGTLNTKQMIDEGRCTIVAEFLRRVQAVIWNRRLMRTKAGRLGLVHEDTDAMEGTENMICILYGCSVPVLLRKVIKKEQEIEAERVEDIEVLRKERAVKVIAAFWKRMMSRRWRREAQSRSKPKGRQKRASDTPFGRAFIWLLRLSGVLGALAFRRFPRIGFGLVAAGGLSIILELPMVFRSSAYLKKRMLNFKPGRLLKSTRLVEPVLMCILVLFWKNMAVETLIMYIISIIFFHWAFATRWSRQRSAPKSKTQAEEPVLRWWDTIEKFDVARLLQHRRLVELVIVVLHVWFFESLVLKIAMVVALLFEWPLGLIAWRQKRQKPQEPQCYWKFMGECYVEGMMNGEAIALQNVDRKTYPIQTFELR